MKTGARVRALRAMADGIELHGRSFLSITELSDRQLYALFELGRALEPWNRSGLDWLGGNVMVTLFYQPSTRTRMSFEAAMLRLGGSVITEATPLIASSAAKEESLNDAMRVISRYANVIVLRHYDDQEARAGVVHSEAPVINGGFGNWEHPTQALLDLYTLWRTFGRVEGLHVCIAGPDLVAARTGHSMALGLARLGARMTLASTSRYRMPEDMLAMLHASGAEVEEVLDPDQASFNDLVSGMDYIYLPGCAAPKGAESDAYKKMMDDFYVRNETLAKVRNEQKRDIYITHALPRRAGEMDPAIDASPSQVCFRAILHSVSVRMALVAAIIG